MYNGRVIKRLGYPTITPDTVINKFQGELPAKIERKFTEIGIDFPCRLNADVLDRPNLAPNEKFVYPAGEIMVSIAKFVHVDLKYLGNDDGHLEIGEKVRRPSIVRHAYNLMCAVLEHTPSLKIDVDDSDILVHCGFGSSGATLGAIASAINELYDKPIRELDLVQYLVGNYAEEVSVDNEKYLKTVPASGGSLATGFLKSSIMVITGSGIRIGATQYKGKVVIGIPTDFSPKSAVEIMKKEENLLLHAKMLKSDTTLFRTLVNEALPNLVTGDFSALSKIVFNTRFNTKGIKYCSFMHAELPKIAKNIRFLYEQKYCDMLSLSSGGPAFFALVSKKIDEQIVINTFKKFGLKTEIVKPYNDSYKLTKKL